MPSKYDYTMMVDMLKLQSAIAANLTKMVLPMLRLCGCTLVPGVETPEIHKVHRPV